MDIPYYFFAFANDTPSAGAWLRNLPREQDALKEALRPAYHKNLCGIVDLASASVQKISEYFNIHRGRIVLFHFAGHADSYELMLNQSEGGSTAADGRSLAAFLGAQPNLQLVFLNACATQAQVSFLLDASVRQVIATSRPVNDDAALAFARHFYQQLTSILMQQRNFTPSVSAVQQAFAEAQNLLGSSYNGKFRAMYAKNETNPPDVFPWVLSSKTVEREGSRGTYFPYGCDRSPQSQRFEQYLSLKKKRCNFFFIHGEKPQSHEGLRKRFFLELRGEHRKVRSRQVNGFNPNIAFVDYDDQHMYKAKILDKLYDEFGLELSQYHKLEDRNLGVVCRESPVLRSMQPTDIISVMFRVESQSWKDFVPDILKWFISDFCNEGRLPPNAPEFYFFLAMVYSEEQTAAPAKSSRLFSFWKKPPDNGRAMLLSTIRQVPQIEELPELTSVSIQDIEAWLSDNEIRRTRSSITEALGDKKFYNMEDVEEWLYQIARQTLR